MKPSIHQRSDGHEKNGDDEKTELTQPAWKRLGECQEISFLFQDWPWNCVTHRVRVLSSWSSSKYGYGQPDSVFDCNYIISYCTCRTSSMFRKAPGQRR